MKILFTNPSLVHAGAERVISIVSNALVEKGHQVELLLYYDQPISYSLDERVKVVIDEREIGKRSKIKHLLWRRKYFKKTDADVIISFLAPFNIFNIVALFGVKKKLIVADRNDPRKVPTNKVMRSLRNFLYRFADGVVVQNTRNRDYFGKAVQKKIAVIFNPVELGEYTGAAVRVPTAEKKKEIVCVGRLIKQKNPHMLLDAFARVADEYPEYKLAFVGDGDMREELSEAARQKGLGDRVELNGVSNKVFERIHRSELFVMSSEYEGMPNALIEAMCIGLPVISTKVSGATDVIESGVNGILVDCRDTEALAEAIRKMLSDDEIRQKCGANAAKLSEQLKVDAIVSEWLDFIDLTLSRKKK